MNRFHEIFAKNRDSEIQCFTHSVETKKSREINKVFYFEIVFLVVREIFFWRVRLCPFSESKKKKKETSNFTNFSYWKKKEFTYDDSDFFSWMIRDTQHEANNGNLRFFPIFCK